MKPIIVFYASEATGKLVLRGCVSYRALSQVAYAAVQEGRAAQLDRDVGHRVVVETRLRKSLELLEVGVPQLLPLRGVPMSRYFPFG